MAPRHSCSIIVCNTTTTRSQRGSVSSIQACESSFEHHSSGEWLAWEVFLSSHFMLHAWRSQSVEEIERENALNKFANHLTLFYADGTTES